MTKSELTLALRHLIYDTLLLSGSISRLPENPKNCRTLCFSNDQMAVEIALIKSRSLVDFLSGKANHPDNLLARDMDCGLSPVKFTEAFDKYRQSVNKFSAHLTKERIHRREYSPPRVSHIIEKGSIIVGNSITAIKQCIANGIVLDKTWKKYWNKLKSINGMQD